MSSKPQRSASKETEATSTQATSLEEIRRRAYEIYLKRGEQQGREVEDWLQAERELERRVL